MWALAEPQPVTRPRRFAWLDRRHEAWLRSVVLRPGARARPVKVGAGVLEDPAQLGLLGTREPQVAQFRSLPQGSATCKSAMLRSAVIFSARVIFSELRAEAEAAGSAAGGWAEGVEARVGGWSFMRRT